MGEELIAKNFLEDSLKMFRQYKKLAEKAIAQLPNPDEDFFFTLDKESNSIAVIMKHLAGNMRSRWQNFLTSDGEKADRKRDTEFEIAGTEDRATIVRIWEEGWACVFDAIEPLKPEDLGRTVMIRHEPHTVVEAINRQLTHYPYHVGQIVFLARHIAEKNWTSLTVPRGKSEEFNAKMLEKFKKP
jgi:uncharacterized protein DUF1572